MYPVSEYLETAKESGQIRSAQYAALSKLRQHFRIPDKPNTALVVLPTGTGKSGVVALAPYVLNCSRVLIITPSVIVSKQLFIDMCGGTDGNGQRLHTFYSRCGFISQEYESSLVENGLLVDVTIGANPDILRQMELHNLVIANVHKLTQLPSLNPENLFDTIIVDEAHHYPAPTWKSIINSFPRSRKIFLTATPYHKGENIVGRNMQEQNVMYTAYTLTRENAVNDRLIRKIEFREVGVAGEDDSMAAMATCVAAKMLEILQSHDRTDSTVFHQGMIVCYRTDEVNEVVNSITDAQLGGAVPYHGLSGPDGFLAFKRRDSVHPPRFLVVCGKATEGFDHPPISVVGILRNIAKTSKVFFSQFVGRCVRLAHHMEYGIVATVVSHAKFAQSNNFRGMDALPEDDEDPVEIDICEE